MLPFLFEPIVTQNRPRLLRYNVLLRVASVVNVVPIQVNL